MFLIILIRHRQYTILKYVKLSYKQADGPPEGIMEGVKLKRCGDRVYHEI